MIETPRLILRRWQQRDHESAIAMGLDPLVMRHFPALQSAEETRALVEARERHFEEHGFGTWAVELKDTGGLIGACGCKYLTWPHTLPSDVEVGWRFHAAAWGKGYATESAAAALKHALSRTKLDLIVSFTVQANTPSWSVMERLKMTRRPDLDFDHPYVPDGHVLKRHIVYVADAKDWAS